MSAGLFHISGIAEETRVSHGPEHIHVAFGNALTLFLKPDEARRLASKLDKAADEVALATYLVTKSDQSN